MPLKQTLILTRVDTESLGLEPGKQITAQFSILNERKSTAFSETVSLRWAYETADEEDLGAVIEDDSGVNMAALSTTALSLFLLHLIN